MSRSFVGANAQKTPKFILKGFKKRASLFMHGFVYFRPCVTIRVTVIAALFHSDHEFGGQSEEFLFKSLDPIRQLLGKIQFTGPEVVSEVFHRIGDSSPTFFLRRPGCSLEYADVSLNRDSPIVKSQVRF